MKEQEKLAPFPRQIFTAGLIHLEEIIARQVLPPDEARQWSSWRARGSLSRESRRTRRQALVGLGGLVSLGVALGIGVIATARAIDRSGRRGSERMLTPPQVSVGKVETRATGEVTIPYEKAVHIPDLALYVANFSPDITLTVDMDVARSLGQSLEFRMPAGATQTVVFLQERLARDDAEFQAYARLLDTAFRPFGFTQVNWPQASLGVDLPSLSGFVLLRYEEEQGQQPLTSEKYRQILQNELTAHVLGIRSAFFHGRRFYNPTIEDKALHTRLRAMFASGDTSGLTPLFHIQDIRQQAYFYPEKLKRIRWLDDAAALHAKAVARGEGRSVLAPDATISFTNPPAFYIKNRSEHVVVSIQGAAARAWVERGMLSPDPNDAMLWMLLDFSVDNSLKLAYGNFFRKELDKPDPKTRLTGRVFEEIVEAVLRRASSEGRPIITPEDLARAVSIELSVLILGSHRFFGRGWDGYQPEIVATHREFHDEARQLLENDLDRYGIFRIEAIDPIFFSVVMRG